MMPLASRLMKWPPRLLALGLVLLFCLPVGYFSAAALLPALAGGVSLVAAWKWPAVGGIAFIGFGIVTPLAFSVQGNWSGYAIVPGEMVVIGLLFLVDWGYHRSMSIHITAQSG